MESAPDFSKIISDKQMFPSKVAYLTYAENFNIANKSPFPLHVFKITKSSLPGKLAQSINRNGSCRNWRKYSKGSFSYKINLCADGTQLQSQSCYLAFVCWMFVNATCETVLEVIIPNQFFVAHHGIYSARICLHNNDCIKKTEKFVLCVFDKFCIQTRCC